MGVVVGEVDGAGKTARWTAACLAIAMEEWHSYNIAIVSHESVAHIDALRRRKLITNCSGVKDLRSFGVLVVAKITHSHVQVEYKAVVAQVLKSQEVSFEICVHKTYLSRSYHASANTHPWYDRVIAKQPVKR